MRVILFDIFNGCSLVKKYLGKGCQAFTIEKKHSSQDLSEK